jgi:hypothetical protein
MILNELEYDGINIALKGSLIKGRDVRLKKLFNIVLSLVKQPLNIKKRIKIYTDSMSKPLSKESIKLFESFQKNHIKPCYYNWSELKQLSHNDDFVAFLCGSDQIWNSDALYNDPLYYLRFAPKSKRIAFAPSFGRNYIANYNKKTIRRYIMEIPTLSVREESAVKIIKDLTNRNAIQLLDPTLVIDKTKWDKALDLQNKTQDLEKYILAYFLNEPSKYAKAFIKNLSSKYQLKVIAIPYMREPSTWYDFIPNTGPREFVKLIKNAFFVCTDSFHGTAFSINYSVPFYTFERQYESASKQSSRVTSLLDLLSLKERFNPLIDVQNISIDFTTANKVLNLERERSVKYLKDAIEKIGDE